MTSQSIVLNRKLVLEDPQRMADGAGGFTQSWTALGEVWAQMHALNGRTADQEGGSLSLQRYRITLRATPQGSASRPRAGQRFRQENRFLRIEAVHEADPAGRYLRCLCIEEIAP